MKFRFSAFATAISLTAALSACGAASESSSESGSGDGVIKVALIPPSTGALAQYGTQEVQGWELAVDEINADGGVDGQKVELIMKETDGQTSTTLQAAREAVTKEGAQYIGAVMTTPEAAALNAQLESLGAVAFNATATDDSLAGENCSRNSFNIIQRGTMDVAAITQALAEIPGDKWAIQAVDYSTGRTAADAFTEAAEKAGKEVVLTQFAPLGTTDFGSYITKIKSSAADAVFAVEFGADGIAFVKQSDQFNLSESLQSIVGYNMISEPLFPALGDGVVGYLNNVGYDVTDQNELNQEFVKAYEAKFDEAPNFVSAGNYLAAQTLFRGIEEAGSSAPEDVAAALKDITFDSIVGEVTMRADDHQLLRNSYLGEVEKADDGLAFKILSTSTADQTTPSANPDCKL